MIEITAMGDTLRTFIDESGHVIEWWDWWWEWTG